MTQPAKPYVPRRHFADLLHAEMARNPDVWLLTGDLGYGMLREIERDYPDRFVNVGAAEQLLVGAGVGLALDGKLPICYSITPFIVYRPAEWIRNYLDHEQINVKLVGAGYGNDYAHDGFSHHIWNLGPTMACYPNLSLYTPSRAPGDLESDFKTFMTDARPGLMALRK